VPRHFVGCARPARASLAARREPAAALATSPASNRLEVATRSLQRDSLAARRRQVARDDLGLAAAAESPDVWPSGDSGARTVGGRLLAREVLVHRELVNFRCTRSADSGHRGSDAFIRKAVEVLA